ncbi:MAG: hypothetical protein QXU98_04125 [Candidatus Parvarchaeota archaeon]
MTTIDENAKNENVKNIDIMTDTEFAEYGIVWNDLIGKNIRIHVSRTIISGKVIDINLKWAILKIQKHDKSMVIVKMKNITMIEYDQ